MLILSRSALYATLAKVSGWRRRAVILADKHSVGDLDEGPVQEHSASRGAPGLELSCFVRLIRSLYELFAN